MRAVVDTNVNALIVRHFSLVTSETLLEELVDILSRPEWVRMLDPTQCRELLAIIREAAVFVRPTEHLTVCRDPEDNALLDCAVAGRVDCLVTGDKDLLVLHPFRGIRILRPAEFLRTLA